MPELPEVEHIVRWLSPHVRGRTIRAVPLADRRLQRGRGEDPATLAGRRIRGIRRRAKLIVLELDRDTAVVFHLKLTGKLWLRPAKEARSAWTRLALDLGRGQELQLEDVRRLGWFRIAGPEEVRALEDAHGPEPLEAGYTFEAFDERRRRRRGAVKPVLLDPAFVAGVGNIYADEILFAAAVHPLEPIETLAPARARRLHRELVRVLEAAVAERRGEPDQERVGSGSKTAARHFERAVFQRTGEPCPRCEHPIERIVVRGRGTHLCPRCQKAPS